MDYINKKNVKYTPPGIPSPRTSSMDPIEPVGGRSPVPAMRGSRYGNNASNHDIPADSCAPRQLPHPVSADCSGSASMQRWKTGAATAGHNEYLNRRHLQKVFALPSSADDVSRKAPSEIGFRDILQTGPEGYKKEESYFTAAITAKPETSFHKRVFANAVEKEVVTNKFMSTSENHETNEQEGLCALLAPQPRSSSPLSLSSSDGPALKHPPSIKVHSPTEMYSKKTTTPVSSTFPIPSLASKPGQQDDSLSSMYSREAHSQVHTYDCSSITDGSESMYLADDEEYSEEEYQQAYVDVTHHGVIGIGIPAPPRKPAPKTEKQLAQESLSEDVARNLAEQEHRLKERRRDVGRKRVPSFAVSHSIIGEAPQLVEEKDTGTYSAPFAQDSRISRVVARQNSTDRRFLESKDSHSQSPRSSIDVERDNRAPPMPIRKSSLKSVPTRQQHTSEATDESEYDSGDENESTSTHSQDSGKDLDPEKVNSIIARRVVGFELRRMNRRHSSYNRTADCPDPSTLREVNSMESAELRKDIASKDMQSQRAVIPIPPMPKTTDRPSDDKEIAKAQRVKSVGDTRSTASSGVVASMSSSRTEREQQKALRSSSSQDGPYGSVASIHADGDEDSIEDLEAQAGIPVVLPGAFAVTTVEEADEEPTGYDSGYEGSRAGTSSDIEAGRESGDESLDAPEPGTPLDAELYEEQYADALVVDEDAEYEKPVTRRWRLFQILSAIAVAIVLGGGVTAAVLTKPGGNDNKAPGCSMEPCLPVVQGWEQVGSNIIGPTDKDNVQLGQSISMSGDGTRLAIGLPGLNGLDEDVARKAGSVHIMDFDGFDWNIVQEIEGPDMNAEAGWTLALSDDGSRLAIGAPKLESDGGYVGVYEETESSGWVMLGLPLVGDDFNGDYFGGSLSFSDDGRFLAIGDRKATVNELSDVGLVHVVTFDGNWTRVGNSIPGNANGDLFGWSLALSGDGKRLAASAIGVNGFAGSVQVFDYQDGTWVMFGSKLDGESELDKFGTSLSLSKDGSVLAVGAPGYTRGKEIGVGRVQAYVASTEEWIAQGDPMEGISQSESFGTSVALSAAGDILVVGSPDSNLFGDTTGFVKAMLFDGLSWVQVGSPLGSPDYERGRFGSSVAISDNGVRVVGAAPFWRFDGLRSNVGQAWVFDIVDGESL